MTDVPAKRGTSGAHEIKVAQPTINEVFAEFLAAEKHRLAARTYRRYEEIIDLLRHSLDGYAYQSLSRAEQASWEKRWQGDEEAGSYCNTFGPEKIPAELGSFLGYFMVRKVMGGADLKRAAGTVTGKLVAWLAEREYIGPDDTADALERTNDAARDLPRAERLAVFLSDHARAGASERILEEWETDLAATITRVEPGKLWFDGIGPVTVPVAASELAEEGWEVSALALGRTRSGWKVLEMGNIYPL